ncbi:MAG: GAF domain-containing protein [Anaerolineae bacterium]|nr:GAF domain-containing protein [Anaerolineae bacterium]NIN94685.1 GAF domain-containing protein [Anaerolineae bacterium]
MREGKSLVVPDVRQDPRFYPLVDEVTGFGTRSILGVPLQVKGQVIGALEALNKTGDGVFTKDDMHILSTLATHAAIAIENARLCEKMAARMREATVLHRVSTRLIRTLNLDQLLEDILEALQRAFGYLNCALLLVDEDAEELYIKAARGYSPELMAAGRIKIGQEGIAGWVAANKVALNVPDVTRDPRCVRWVKETRSEIAVPMLIGDEVIGVLDAQNSEVNAFNEDDLRVLSSVAAQTAIAIERARLYGKIQRKKKRLEVEREREEQEKQRIRELFQRYVAPTVVERLIEGMDQVALGGKRQVVTTLFADIRGFTSFSETRMPEELIETLNRYLSLAAQAVLEQEGTLDKFMGDAVMAIFNAPLHQPDHTLRAVRAALAMKEAIVIFHQELDSELRLDFGVGINVGEAVVGNIGAAKLMNYTAIGDSVNLAKRLQENAEAGQILLSQSAYDAVREHVRARALKPIKVKGRSSTEPVYELISLIQ